MNLVRIAVLLLAASCSAQTSIFDVTIGKPVNAKLPDCDTSEDKPCVKSHYNDDSSAGTSSGEVFFPGDVGTVEYKELDGKVGSFLAYTILATKTRFLLNSARSLDRHQMYLA